MKVRILRPALEDLSDGRRFYEMQGEGLGEYFFNSLFSEIDSLALYGGVHALHFGFHRHLARRFPYAIYYRVMQDEAVVFRVLDCRSEPRLIRKKLGAHPRE